MHERKYMHPTKMDYSALIFLSIAVIFMLNYLLKSSSKTKLPPGPTPWPIIGNLHLLGSNPHHSVTELSKKYGPMMTLKLGTISTIVISSPEIAKEMFCNHDLTFSSRHLPDASTVADQRKYSMVWLPVGPKWRDLRKISAVQLFTNQRLDANQGLRKKKVDELVQFVRACSEKGLAIDIGKAASTTSLNLLSSTFFSKDLGSYDPSVPEEFMDLNRRILDEATKPNVSDLFPLLKALDLQGVRRRQTAYFAKMMEFYEGIISERLKDETGGNAGKDDVLDTLLKLVKNDELTMDDIKHLFVILFIGGIDPTSSTLEWAMTELLKHPKIMAKAQAEVDQVLGKCQLRSIEESDISNLPYIQAIVKETLRLHPPAPFLLPRKTDKDVQLRSHHVPKHAQVWVNIWSMSRDPTIWTNPKSFMPERFIKSELDYKRQNFEFMPFGSGRRICPGLPLAHRMVPLMLSNLLHSFNWKLDGDLNPKDVNTEDKFGTILQKAQPIKAIPLPR